jgi:hypothetical protein
MGEKPYFGRRKTLFGQEKNPILMGEKPYLGRRKTLFWVEEESCFSLFIRFYRGWFFVEYTTIN